MSWFESLTFWIGLINAITGGTFLPVVAVALIALMVCAHVALWERMRGRRPSVEAMADPAHNPALDRSEALLRGWDERDGS